MTDIKSQAFIQEQVRVSLRTCDAANGRLDVFLAHELGVTRSFVQRLLKENRVALVNDNNTQKKLKPSSRVEQDLDAAYCVTLPSPEGCDAANTRLDIFLAQELGVTRSCAQRLIEENRVTLEFCGQKKLKPSSQVAQAAAYCVTLPPPEGCDAANTRLDIFLTQKLGMTRSFAQRLIEENRVTLVPCEQKKLKPSSRVTQAPDASYCVTLPPPEGIELEPMPVEPDFEIVYEDEFLLVINKPAGLVVHPAPGHWRNTLVHGLLWRYPDMRLLRERLRPGIVHRLDATTSGLMIAARRQDVLEKLKLMFQERSVTKEYLALVHGLMAGAPVTLSGPIARDPDNPLRMSVIEGGRPAFTGCRVLWSKNFCHGPLSLVICSLFTGRTHQIRVHLSAAGHPLVGDTLYGAPDNFNFNSGRVFLHSWRLAFKHPVTGEQLSFSLPLAPELREFLHGLNT